MSIGTIIGIGILVVVIYLIFFRKGNSTPKVSTRTKRPRGYIIPGEKTPRFK